MKISTLQKGLVLHVPLSQERYNPATKRVGDLTPHSNHGTSANAASFTTDRMGQSDRAMSFNGTSDYVDCGDDASLLMGTNDFSVTGWIKSSGSSTHACLVTTRGTGAPGGNPGWGVRLYSTGELSIELDDGNAGTSFAGIKVGTTNLVDNSWHHFVMNLDRSDLVTAYVDGNPDGTLNISGGGDVTGSNDLFLARAPADTAYYFNGSLSDVRIYNRALSQQEITALYEAYRPQLSTGSLMSGLVLDMPLTSKRYNAGNSKFDDLTPYENRGTNNGADVDTDHSTFVSANSDNVRIADTEALSPTSAMSSFIWVKGGTGGQRFILSHYDYGINQRAFCLATYTNKLGCYMSDDGTLDAGHAKYYVSSIVSLDNIWHLVGFTFDAGTLKLYIDGVEDTNPTKTEDDAITTIHNSTADIMVGCFLNSDAPADFFGGDLSGAKIYNRALSPQEVKSLYDKGR